MKISKCPSSLHRLSQHSPMRRPRRPADVNPIAMRMRSGNGAFRSSNIGAMRSATKFSQDSRFGCCTGHLQESSCTRSHFRRSEFVYTLSFANFPTLLCQNVTTL
ncbi:hypothetical protein DP44_5687 [Burkholderia pseudomallei]|nr:hypothetical protein DP44_5687 [Burkholderia pseudomallei]